MRPAPDFVHRTTTTFLCAVPPNLPSDPEGRAPLSRRRPLLRSGLRPGERVMLRRNRYYTGRGHTTSTGSTSISPHIRLRTPSASSIVAQADWGYVTFRDLLRQSLGHRREVRDQPLEVLRQARVHSADACVQFCPGCVPKQSKPPEGGELRAQPAGDRQRDERPTRFGPQRPVPPIRRCPASGTRTSTRSITPTSRERKNSPKAICPVGRSSCTQQSPLPMTLGTTRETTAHEDRARRGSGRDPASYRFRGLVQKARRNPESPGTSPSASGSPPTSTPTRT